MPVEYRIVEGAAFAAQASRLLTAAWPLPALHYSPEYVGWQLAFPGPCPAPAAAAFSGSAAVGFAAATHRRLRIGASDHDVLVVTFVAVDPAFRNQGIASGLYATLLGAVRALGLAVVTFGRADSAGQRAIERAYPAAGLALHSFGTYGPHAAVVRSPEGASEWSVAEAVPSLTIADVLARNAPTPQQWEHYFRDPRLRRLLVHEDGAAWAWAVQLEYASAKGIEAVTTLESIWLDRPERLPGLAAAAAQLWPAKGTIVHAPNLWGIDAAALRSLGFRQIGTPWAGYRAGADLPAPGTNLEIV